MMTSSNGNIFRVTGHLCGEFTGPRWIPPTKASDAELSCFLWSVPWINSWVNNREAGDLRRHCAHYGVVVIRWVLSSYVIRRISYERLRTLEWRHNWHDGVSQITRLTIVYSIVYSGVDETKHQRSGSLAFVRGIHRWPVNTLHKWPVTQKMFPFDDVTMFLRVLFLVLLYTRGMHTLSNIINLILFADYTNGCISEGNVDNLMSFNRELVNTRAISINWTSLNVSKFQYMILRSQGMRNHFVTFTLIKENGGIKHGNKIKSSLNI